VSDVAGVTPTLLLVAGLVLITVPLALALRTTLSSPTRT
jgi:hypothetical protein